MRETLQQELGQETTCPPTVRASPFGSESKLNTRYRSSMLAWVAYQRRADCMREYWGYNLHHILSPFGKHKVFKPLDYMFKGVKSFAILFRERPNVIWLQLPPSPLLYVAWIYRTFIDSNVKIVIDAHNSLMRSKWLNFPFTLRLLNQAHTFLAHNEAAANEFRRLGVNELKI